MIKQIISIINCYLSFGSLQLAISGYIIEIGLVYFIIIAFPLKDNTKKMVIVSANVSGLFLRQCLFPHSSVFTLYDGTTLFTA